jgi:hypothetical protein
LTRDVRWAISAFGVRIYPSGPQGVRLFTVTARSSVSRWGTSISGPNLTSFVSEPGAAEQVEEGKDPIEKRSGRSGQTFGDLLDKYINDHEADKNL